MPFARAEDGFFPRRLHLHHPRLRHARSSPSWSPAANLRGFLPCSPADATALLYACARVHPPLMTVLSAWKLLQSQPRKMPRPFRNPRGRKGLTLRRSRPYLLGISSPPPAALPTASSAGDRLVPASAPAAIATRAHLAYAAPSIGAAGSLALASHPCRFLLRRQIGFASSASHGNLRHAQAYYYGDDPSEPGSSRVERGYANSPKRETTSPAITTPSPKLTKYTHTILLVSPFPRNPQRRNFLALLAVPCSGKLPPCLNSDGRVTRPAAHFRSIQVQG